MLLLVNRLRYYYTDLKKSFTNGKPILLNNGGYNILTNKRIFERKYAVTNKLEFKNNLIA